MRLNNYLLESTMEPRGRILQEEEALTIAWKHCSQAIKNKISIIRYSESHESYRFVDPMVRIRSLDLPTYNLILPTLPSWKGYPRRDMCLIGRTWLNPQIDNYLIRYHHVLFFDNSKIAMSDHTDFWFHTIIGDTTIMELSTTVDKILKLIGIHKPWSKEDMEEIYGKWDREIKDYIINKVNINDIDYENERQLDFMRQYWGKNPSHSVKDYLDYALDPKTIGVKLGKPNSRFLNDKEVWSEGKALLVPGSQYETFKGEVVKWMKNMQ